MSQTYAHNWWVRLDPAFYELVKAIENDPFVVEFLESENFESVDDLNNVQIANLWLTFTVQKMLMDYEGKQQWSGQREQVRDDFPLHIGTGT